MKTLRKEKGITLLSLIITIVLLLIVSGVTLNITIGDNGLLNKSKEAVNKGKLAQTEELIKMDLLSAYIDAELLGMDKPSSETIKKIVESYGGTIDESNPNIIQTPNGEINLDKILGETSSDTNDPDEINKTIESLNNRITELNKELETERNEKKELQNSVNELNEQIEELNTQVADWKKKAEDGEVTIAQRDETISNLNNQIEAKNTEITTKAQRIEELEGNVTTLTNEKSTLETQVTNLNTRIAELEGKQATGDALAQDVLAGKTFSTANGVGQTGIMVNRGTLNFNPTTETTQAIESGYYSGGTISNSNAIKIRKSSSSVDGIFNLINQSTLPGGSSTFSRLTWLSDEYRPICMIGSYPDQTQTPWVGVNFAGSGKYSVYKSIDDLNNGVNKSEKYLFEAVSGDLYTISAPPYAYYTCTIYYEKK